MASMEHHMQIQILLIGMSGSGKSSVGNLLLGQKVFEVGRTGITRTSQIARRQLKDGSELVIVDTPGYGNIHLTEDEIQTEINRGMELLAPGPHIIMYVQSVRQALTSCDVQELQTLTEKFEFHNNHFFLLFSGIDDLDENVRTLDEFIQKNKEMSMLLKQQTPVQVCSKRFDDITEFRVLVKAITTHYTSLLDLEKNTVPMYGKPNRVETAHALTVNVRSRTMANEIRVLLVGKTGSGKSSVGNQLIGSKVFKVGRNCITRTSQIEKRKLKDGSELVIVDTPGYCNIHLSEDETQTEINRGMELLAPVPHCIIMVFSLSERVTGDDIKRLENFQSVFDMYFQKHVIVVFTGMDEFEDEGQTLNEYIERLPQQLKYFLSRLGTKPLGVTARHHTDIDSSSQITKAVQLTYKKLIRKRIDNTQLDHTAKPETCRQEAIEVDGEVYRRGEYSRLRDFTQCQCFIL